MSTLRSGFASLSSVFCLAMLASCGLLACIAEEGALDEPALESDKENLGADEQELLGGTYTNTAPGAVGRISGCTASIVDPRFVLTAAHCTAATGANAGAFVYSNESAWANYDYVHQLWNPYPPQSGYEHDLALLRLSQPALAATPARIATGLPASGTACIKYGAGCQDRTTQAGAGSLQFINFNWPDSYVNCPGDSGGPAFCGNEIAGINSGYQPSGLDIEAHAYQSIALLNAARSLGAPTVHNPTAPSFANAAAQAGAKVVAGRFDWGRDRLAVVGGSGPNGIMLLTNTANLNSDPVAWSTTNASITNAASVEFGTWASQARGAVAADFNGDGRDDIALYGGAGWVTIPVAFSNADGSFTVTNNYQAGDMAHWWNHPNAKIGAGDVDADGDADLIISGVVGWNSIPVGLSLGNGSFSPVAVAVADFPQWATTAGAQLLAGDFNGDGATDVALSGPSGWGTIPVAYSNFDGTFSVTNHPVAYFASWVGISGVRLTVGDFDGDGDDDIGASGAPGWVTALFALSSRNGFEAANMTVTNFPQWASVAQMVSGDFNGDSKADLGLAGGPGWSSAPVLSMSTQGLPWLRSAEFINGTFSVSDSTLGGRYVDDYYYTADVSTPIQVVLARTSSSSVDTYLQVIDTTDWSLIAVNDDAPGMGYDSRLSFTPVRGRSYVLRATTYGQGVTGDYQIMAAPAVVVKGDSYSGSLDRDDGKAPANHGLNRKFVDDLIFFPTSNNAITINLSAAFDTMLEVRYAKNGFLVAQNDDCGGGTLNSCVTLNPLDHSPLIVRVTSYSQLVTGGYTVSAN